MDRSKYFAGLQDAFKTSSTQLGDQQMFAGSAQVLHLLQVK